MTFVEWILAHGGKREGKFMGIEVVTHRDCPPKTIYMFDDRYTYVGPSESEEGK